MRKRDIIINIINMIFCAAIVVLLHTIFHPCLKGMRCVQTTRMCEVFVLVCFGLNALSLILREALFTTITPLVQVLLGLGCFLAIKIGGSCRMPDMACNLYTMPLIKISAGILCIIGIGVSVWNVINAKNNNKEYSASES